MHRVHVVRAGFDRLVAFHAPGHEELSTGIELDDARVGVTVADEEGPVREPRDLGRPGKMALVVARYLALAERHHQLLAVVGALVDRARTVVYVPAEALG